MPETIAKDRLPMLMQHALADLIRGEFRGWRGTGPKRVSELGETVVAVPRIITSISPPRMWNISSKS